MAIGKSQPFGILFAPHHRIYSAIDGAFHTDGQHVGIDIGDGNVGTRFFHAERNVARAPCHIEYVFALLGFDTANKFVLPQSVHAAGHGIVHDVIFAGDGREDPAYALGFFFGANLFIAKGYGFAHGTAH